MDSSADLRDRQPLVARLVDELTAVNLIGLRLLAQRGRRGGCGVRVLSRFVLALVRLFDRHAVVSQQGPDGTISAITRLVWRGARAWTAGNVYLMVPAAAQSPEELLFTSIHEYTHVLQYRAEGVLFLWRYLWQGLYNWEGNRYEREAVAVEEHYRAHPSLPPPWELHLSDDMGRVGGQPSGGD